MRILFDSKKEEYKSPFGTLTPGQPCRLQVQVPSSVGATKVLCVLQAENGDPVCEAQLTFQGSQGAYDGFRGSFSLEKTGLYFYYFRICKAEGSFRLFSKA